MVIERYFNIEYSEECPKNSEALQCHSSQKTGRSFKRGLLLLVSTRPLKIGPNTLFIGDRQFKVSPGSFSLWCQAVKNKAINS